MSKNRNRSQFSGSIRSTAPAQLEDDLDVGLNAPQQTPPSEPTPDVPEPKVDLDPVEDELEFESNTSLNQDDEEEEETTYNEDGEDLGDVSTQQPEVTAGVPEPSPLVYPYTEITDWTMEQLENYISRPETMDIYHSKLVKAINIHRQVSTKLDTAWTVDECTQFFKEHVTPAKTTTGCYKNDVTRKDRREASWTTQELEAWALGEITPEGMVTQNGLAVELHERLKMPIQSVAPEMVIAHYKHRFCQKDASIKVFGEIQSVKQTAVVIEPTEVEPKRIYPGLTHMNQTYIEESLKEYIDAVKPNRIVPEGAGFKAQRMLDNVIMSILKEQDPAGVKSGLDILFTTIVAERITNTRGVFSDTNAYRFIPGITELNNVQANHRALLTLFFTYIDSDEGIIAQTDPLSLVTYLPTRQQNLVLGYLGLS